MTRLRTNVISLEDICDTVSNCGQCQARNALAGGGEGGRGFVVVYRAQVSSHCRMRNAPTKCKKPRTKTLDRSSAAMNVAVSLLCVHVNSTNDMPRC